MVNIIKLDEKKFERKIYELGEIAILVGHPLVIDENVPYPLHVIRQLVDKRALIEEIYKEIRGFRDTLRSQSIDFYGRLRKVSKEESLPFKGDGNFPYVVKLDFFYEFPSGATNRCGSFQVTPREIGFLIFYAFPKEDTLPYDAVINMLIRQELQGGEYEFAARTLNQTKIIKIGEEQPKLEDLVKDARDLAIIGRIFENNLHKYRGSPNEYGGYEIRREFQKDEEF